MQCPYCGETCYAEWVDIGIGDGVQVTPYECEECGARQITPFVNDHEANDKEREIGWFKGAEYTSYPK
jgi:C4-type Zn-finger protein